MRNKRRKRRKRSIAVAIIYVAVLCFCVISAISTLKKGKEKKERCGTRIKSTGITEAIY